MNLIGGEGTIPWFFSGFPKRPGAGSEFNEHGLDFTIF
jgi:hypothetical protein